MITIGDNKEVNYKSGFHEFFTPFHREDGPAIEWTNGNKYWYKFGVLHRLDGPAIETNYTKEWYVNGNFIKRERWK